MSRRPPSTYLTVDEQKSIAAIKFKEAVPTAPEQDQMKSADRHQNFGEMKSYLASKEVEPAQ
jgi:hypothetical protein